MTYTKIIPCYMQKNTRVLAKFALFFWTLLILVVPQVAAQEERSFTTSTPGMYRLAENNQLAGLLVPQSSKRWNLVYQNQFDQPMVAGVQYDNQLHMFVTAQTVQPLEGEVLAASTDFDTDDIQDLDEAENMAAATPKPTATPTPVVVQDRKDADQTAGQSGVVKRPEPTPVVVAKSAPTFAPSDLDGLFETYGAQYGVSATMLKHIAICESGLRPEALSRNGLYGGLFQFVSSTWSSNRKAMGEDPDPALRFNAEEAIKTAAFKISRDGVGAWPVCGRKATAAQQIAAI